MSLVTQQAIPDRISRGYMAEWLAKLPNEWHSWALDAWRQEWDQSGLPGDRRRAANTAVRHLVDLRDESPLPLSATDDDLRSLALVRASWWRSFTREPIRWRPEDPSLYGAKTPDGAAARVEDPLWWRRRLRRQHGRCVEHAGQRAGMVRADRHLYVTDTTLKRRAQQQAGNRTFLETMQAVNEASGETHDLVDLADASVSNPVNRRNELMVRMAGFERTGREMGAVPLFITLTCPSRFHRARKVRGKSGTIVTDNPNWNGSTPVDGQQWLRAVWARVRAAAKRRGIQFFGFRIAEPQHDGTPHWHLLLFVPRQWLPLPAGPRCKAPRRQRTTTFELRRLLRHYALEDAPGEVRGKWWARCDIRRINYRHGTATGYVAKYVSKNIDGAALSPEDPAAARHDALGRDPVDTAARVDAWASTWGIRQFQQLGGAPVTVWRLLRAMDWREDGPIGEAQDCAEANDWAGFCKSVQAAGIRPAYLQDVDFDTGEMETNRYGEPAEGRVIGVEHEGRIILIKDRYRIEAKESAQCPDSSPDSTAEAATTKSEAGTTCCEEPSRPDDVDAVGRVLRVSAEVTERGARVTGIPAGTVLPWSKAVKEIPAAEGPPWLAIWRARWVREDSAPASVGAPWSSVNNCTYSPFDTWNGPLTVCRFADLRGYVELANCPLIPPPSLTRRPPAKEAAAASPRRLCCQAPAAATLVGAAVALTPPQIERRGTTA